MNLIGQQKKHLKKMKHKENKELKINVASERKAILQTIFSATKQLVRLEKLEKMTIHIGGIVRMDWANDNPYFYKILNIKNGQMLLSMGKQTLQKARIAKKPCLDGFIKPGGLIETTGQYYKPKKN